MEVSGQSHPRVHGGRITPMFTGNNLMLTFQTGLKYAGSYEKVVGSSIRLFGKLKGWRRQNMVCDAEVLDASTLVCWS